MTSEVSQTTDEGGAASGQLIPPHAVVLAPLAGYTDEPFRRQCRGCGCRYAFTPLVDAQAVVHNTDRNRTMLLRAPDEPWLGIQLLGRDPGTLAEAARRLNDRSFEVLDFNLGCPMPKLLRRRAGAALAEDPAHAARCLAALVAASRFPVTAKIRILDEDDPKPTIALVKRLVSAGAQLVTIHARVRSRLYAGPPQANIVRAVQEVTPVPVVANGGVFDAETANALRKSSGCTRIMVARGAVGNPWIFREIGAYDSPPTHAEVCTAFEEHVQGMIALYGEDCGLRNARKIMAAYLKGRGYPRTFRYQASQLATIREFRQLLEELTSLFPRQTPVPTGKRNPE